MRIAPVHVCLTVSINPHRRVDVVPVLLLPYKRFADGVVEWSVGRVGNQHTDAVPVYGTVHIELPVALYHLLSPCSVFTVVPLEVLQRRHSTMILPVHHILGGEEQPVFHLELIASGIVLVVCGIEKHLAVVHHRRRVGGELRLHHRHLRAELHIVYLCLATLYLNAESGRLRVES